LNLALPTPNFSKSFAILLRLTERVAVLPGTTSTRDEAEEH